MIHGPDLEGLKEQAKLVVQASFVATAESDGTPATLRAMYVLKAQQAEAFLAGTPSDMITEEAEIRGVPAMALAETIVAMSKQSQELEMARMRVNMRIQNAADEGAVVDILDELKLSL